MSGRSKRKAVRRKPRTALQETAVCFSCCDRATRPFSPLYSPQTFSPPTLTSRGGVCVGYTVPHFQAGAMPIAKGSGSPLLAQDGGREPQPLRADTV